LEDSSVVTEQAGDRYPSRDPETLDSSSTVAHKRKTERV
jgi:hypothetical protein